MFSSIFSFILRNIILEPMALLGVIIAAAGWYMVGPEALLQYTQVPATYLVLYAISLLYAVTFKHVYYINSKKINWWETVKSSFSHLLTILFAAACVYAIIYAFNYGLGEKLDSYLRHE
ncbi:MAG: hypothetical protein J6Y91_03045 [Alphaproteobacteria bacterium]|nr:hypothetical protein [Alphaproteobacteria bacterium]